MNLQQRWIIEAAKWSWQRSPSLSLAYIYMDLWPSFTVMCWYLAVLSTISGYSRDIEYKLKQTFQNQCKLVQCTYRYYIALSIALYCICHMLRLNVISHCCWRDVTTAGHQSWLKFLQPLIAAWPNFAKHTKKMDKRFPHTSKKHKPRLVKLCRKKFYSKLPSARVLEGKCRSRPTCELEAPIC